MKSLDFSYLFSEDIACLKARDPVTEETPSLSAAGFLFFRGYPAENRSLQDQYPDWILSSLASELERMLNRASIL